MPETDNLPLVEADLAVVGFGKGGKTLAAALAKARQQVVMIEQSDQMYGGTCINIGCVPTKALVYQAEHPDRRQHPGQWYEQAIAKKSTLTALLRSKNFAMLDTPETSTVITGRATFTGPHTLLVTAGADQLRVRAETIVVNTGSEPVLPPIPGLRESKYVVTSTGLLSRTPRPSELVILGGGFVGVEFASMHAAFGTKVTLLHHGERLVHDEDTDVSAAVEELLIEAGVRVLTGVAVREVSDLEAAARVTYEGRDGTRSIVVGDVVLAALGRRPATAGLGLERVGIAVDDRGAIVVDEYLRTSLPHVFAVGDVNGGPQFTYVSLDDYRIVLDQLTGEGKRSTAGRIAVPAVTFMTPPLARVGMTETRARATGRPVKVATRKVADMATVPRAKIVGEPRGLMKAVVDAQTDAVLGATILAYDAHELINVIALAMRHGITATTLRDEIYTHPSMTEAFNDLFANLTYA
jgi:pyruvate/2-oxoglutarate dehydrogenase complex dihydrolipoamide dehydrogenase (E3) component